MGQLQLYQWALENQEPERSLFLAISYALYIRHFQKPIFQLAVQRNRINTNSLKLSDRIRVEEINHR